MPNERNVRLRNAMRAAGVDIEAVARAARVDERTVYRWMEEGRVPRAEQRSRVARLLHQDERSLWPPTQRRGQPTKATAEIVAAYARREQLAAAAWRELILQAEEQIDLLGYSLIFLTGQLPDLAQVLKDKEPPGTTRIALADPVCEQVQMRDAELGLGGALAQRIRRTLDYFEELRTVESIEVRYHEATAYNSIFRFDDQMLVTPHLYATPATQSPLLHLRRLRQEGIFDSFATHFEKIWTSATLLRPWGK